MARILETTDDKPMRSLAEVLQPKEAPTGRDTEIVGAVHALAAEYDGLPSERRPAFLSEVRKLTTGYDRFRATVFTPPDHPAFRSLMAMLDGLNADSGIIQTRHGALFREGIVRN